jgi:hypothetical protein
MAGIRRKADPTDPCDIASSWRKRLGRLVWEMQELSDFATNANHEGIAEMTDKMRELVKDARDDCLELERVCRIHEDFKLKKAKSLDDRAKEYHETAFARKLALSEASDSQKTHEAVAKIESTEGSWTTETNIEGGKLTLREVPMELGFEQLPVMQGAIEKCRVIGCPEPATEQLPSNIESTRGKYVPVNVCLHHRHEVNRRYTKKGTLRESYLKDGE